VRQPRGLAVTEAVVIEPVVTEPGSKRY